MAVLPILKYPDPRLETIADPVVNIDLRVCTLVANMFETLSVADGIGLAATQVNVHEQIIVIRLCIEEERERRWVLINPKILKRSEIRKFSEEGCLSVPQIYAKVERPESVTVEAMDENANKQTIEADGMLAVVVQHEIDHLFGKIFVDHLSGFKRERIRKKMIKRNRDGG